MHPAYDDALANLQQIRRTMADSTRFTAVPGLGLVWVGATALATAWVASRWGVGQFDRWMVAWVTDAIVGSTILALAMQRKAERVRAALLSGPGQRALLGLLPPIAAGGVLTAVLYMRGMATPEVVPGLWLLLYGVGVIAAGANSVPLVPVMGGCFVMLGVAAFAVPGTLALWLVPAGFGIVNIVFGAAIARRHGG